MGAGMIKIASLPRSGHHWLMNLVQDACKLPCNWHKDLHLDKPGPDCLVAKTHDFDLSEGAVQFVQWRDPVESLCSWYELGIKHKNWQGGELHWKRWSIAQMQYVAEFYRKWKAVTPDERWIDYNDLRADPDKYVRLIASEIDRPVLRTVGYSTTEKRCNSDFAYYEFKHFDLLRELFKALK